MWELDYNESWAPKNWCFWCVVCDGDGQGGLVHCDSWGRKESNTTERLNWTDVLEKTLENLLDSKEMKPVHPKGNQLWIFIGRTGTEAEASLFWPPVAKSWLIRKDPDAGKDLRNKEKGMIENDMVGWHHQLNGHEFEKAPGHDEGQGSLACCCPWGCKE